MSAPPLIRGEGTPEALWAGWGRTFEPFRLDGCSRLVVVAPHPDDEVLGVGGLMVLAAARGVEVTVVAVTDGEASHPGSPTLAPSHLSMLRPGESEAALTDLGVPLPTLRLRVPDGGVADHEDEVARRLAAVVAAPAGPGRTDGSGRERDRGDPGDPAATWVVTTWRGDGHPDHEAVGRAGAAACATTGARLVEHPVWTWHWATPDEPRVPWERARSLALPQRVRRAKELAVSRFTTQVAPLSDHPADAAVLPPHVLARLLRDRETLFV